MFTRETIIKQIDSLERVNELLIRGIESKDNNDCLMRYVELLQVNVMVIAAVLEKFEDVLNDATPECSFENKEKKSHALTGVVNVNEAAEILRISSRSVYELINEKKLKCIKVGRAIRIPRVYLDEFIKGRNSI